MSTRYWTSAPSTRLLTAHLESSYGRRHPRWVRGEVSKVYEKTPPLRRPGRRRLVGLRRPTTRAQRALLGLPVGAAQAPPGRRGGWPGPRGRGQPLRLRRPLRPPGTHRLHGHRDRRRGPDRRRRAPARRAHRPPGRRRAARGQPGAAAVAGAAARRARGEPPDRGLRGLHRPAAGLGSAASSSPSCPRRSRATRRPPRSSRARRARRGGARRHLRRARRRVQGRPRLLRRRARGARDRRRARRR